MKGEACSRSEEAAEAGAEADAEADADTDAEADSSSGGVRPVPRARALHCGQSLMNISTIGQVMAAYQQSV